MRRLLFLIAALPAVALAEPQAGHHAGDGRDVAAGEERALAGPFPLLLTPWTEDARVDIPTLLKEAEYVEAAGVGGMIWPSAGERKEILDAGDYEAALDALVARSVEKGREFKARVTAVVSGTNTAQGVEQAAAVERLARKHDARLVILARPADDCTNQVMILDYYNALAKATSQTVIIQTFNGKSPQPSVETIVSLAREHGIYGYVKEESPGLQVNGRMEQLLRHREIKGVFSGWGGKGWVFQGTRIGTCGVISQRAAYAPLFVKIWNRIKAGADASDPELARAYSSYLYMANLGEIFSTWGDDEMRGPHLYVLQWLGIFKNRLSRQGGKAVEFKMSDKEKAEVDARLKYIGQDLVVDGWPCAAGADGLEVVCVYYPHWHRYPKGDEWFGAENWKEGEWTFVKTAKPRFPGHRQPLVPSAGYLDGANPEDVAKEIDLASDAGIDVFLYDYYWYDGKVTQEESLEKGFLRARNRARMKFALMWCYHERRDQFRPKLGEPRRVLMSLAHTKDEFLGLIRYSVDHYFNKAEYWRKDGRLFFSIYDAHYFCSKRGNDAGRIKAELDEAREIVRAAGLGELHLNAQCAGPKLADFMADCGFDSLTDYNTSPYHMPTEVTSAMRAKGEWEIDYRASFPIVRKRWKEMSSKRLPYIPNVTTGWDSTPRCRLDEPYPWKALDYPYTMTFTNNTPEAFREILAEAKAHAENDPKKPGAVYINGWNEYTEGTYLIPNNFDSDGALRAIESVFGRSRDKERDCAGPVDSKHCADAASKSEALTSKE